MLLENPTLIMIASGSIGFAASLLTLKYILRSFIKLGIYGVDYHKPEKPRIPEMGGLAFIIGVLTASLPAFLLNLYVSETLGIL
ncbi:MAG: hypothetical protein QW304_08395, partial [Thermoproteota archaeon]